MSSKRIRSSSLGAQPRVEKHTNSRVHSAASGSLDVRCACQYFQSDSLLPEKIIPAKSHENSRDHEFLNKSGNNTDKFDHHYSLNKKVIDKNSYHDEKFHSNDTDLKAERFHVNNNFNSQTLSPSLRQVSKDFEEQRKLGDQQIIAEINIPKYENERRLKAIDVVKEDVSTNRLDVELNPFQTLATRYKENILPIKDNVQNQLLNDNESCSLTKENNIASNVAFVQKTSIDVSTGHLFSSISKPQSFPSSSNTIERKLLNSNILRRKQYLTRTQSDDKAKPIIDGTNNEVKYSISKTVSFDFAQLANEKFQVNAKHTSLSTPYIDKDDWIDRTYLSRDHVYEPIGEPSNLTSENNKLENFTQDEVVKENIQPPELPASNGSNKIEDNFILNERPDSREDNSCISSGIASSRSESRTEEIHTSQVDSSALEHLPLRSENRKRSFMANAQEKSRKVHQSLRSHAGKLKTKLSKMNKPVSGSPKLKEKKKFLGRDFGKLKFDIKKPELGKNQNPTMPKFKSPDFKKIEFKRPDFSKITKPDFSKFKLPEKFSSLKLRRSRSLKEQNSSIGDISSTEPQVPESNVEKKKFDLHFATYPRILRKKKSKAQREVTSNSSDMRSTESPISTESSAILKQKVFKTGPIVSSWGDKFSEVSFGDSESGKYQKYDSEPENDNINVKESADAFNEDNKYSESPTASSQMEAIGSDELKQLAAYNEENRAIHEISKIRENEFKSRKPFVHQDSDVISEESRDAFSEKKIEHNILERSETDSEHIQDDLNNFVDEGYKVDVNEVANQDAQSTESSSAFRRKGVIEEIDDDEFFLRKKGISDENIQIREYISSAIREGLSSGQNALMQMTKEPYCSYEQSEGIGTVNYTYDVPPAKPRRIKQFSNPYCDQKSDIDVSVTDDQELPVRPSRKHKAQKISDQPEEDINFLDNHDKGFEINAYDVPRRSSFSLEMFLENDENSVQPQDPPKAPKRRKKCIEQVIEDEEHVGIQTKEHASHHCPSDNTEREIVVYRTEHEYIIPLAQIDSFSAPSPPRRSRSRSRSQTSRLTEDDQISHTSDSQFSDNQLARHFRDTLDMNESDGYARIRKDAPTRPPAPIRRKKSSNSLEERRFATMPSCKVHPKTFDEASTEEEGAPKRPPRRKSTTSLEEISNILSNNLTQYEYEEVDNDDIQNTESPRNLQSGEVMKKMKYRPLPPPPRPPREGRKSKDNIESQNNQDSFTEVVKLIEVEVSTQTDPLPEDFTCEEFEITEDMKVIEPRRTKTLEDILKEEQEAELERAKQLAEDDVLSRSIQKFRESNHRSFSEKSRTSTTDNIRNSTSRPNTPSAIIIERRIPTPITSEICETLVEASLTVQPVEYDENIQDGIESDIENEKNCYKSKPVQMHGNELEQSCSSEPPHPPPRKKFSIGDECPHRQQSCEEIDGNQTKDINKASLKSLSNSRDKIAELEVDHFSANAIDATSITVSKLQGTSFNVQDFECKSGNLTVQNIELPKGFIDEIIERIRSSEQEFLQTLTQTLGHEEPPARPPPPEQHNLHPELVQMHPLGQALLPQRRSPEKEIQQVNVHRRRRHHRRRDSSSSDLQRDSRMSRVYTHSPEKSITHLFTQLLSACGATALRTINQILNSLNISEKEYNNQNMRIIVIIFIVMTLGFLLMGMAGAKNIHHHHWDYFNPPGNGGRT